MRRKTIFFLYRLVQTLLFPLILLYLLYRGLRQPRYLGTLRERFGGLPLSWKTTASGSIWLHAVSVGEVIAAIPLIGELRKRNPATRFFVSVSTLAGYETAENRLAGVKVFYAPLDFVWCVRRVLRWLQPSLVVVMETEIWPNLFREARRIGCGLAIVNGRISDRALPRYRRHAWFFSAVLPLCDRILAQSDEMRERFIEAGAPANIVTAAGNLKYDFKPRELAAGSPVREFLKERTSAPVWIAASTSEDGRIEEEDVVITAQGALSGWRLILVPRKPERFDAVGEKLAASGLRWTRRSALEDSAADVLLLDSIGELSGLFPFAKVVFMGGTLAEKGGHNVLEPALFGKPVIAGPHLENFRDIEAHFEKHNALLRITEASELASAVTRAASDAELGERALAAAEMERGATARIADSLQELYESRYPDERRAQPAWFFLWCFAKIWQAGSAWDRRAKRGRASELPVPVVSVGNITAGGTGKTPVTIELLREFECSRAALVTRGHGRGTSEILVLPTGKEQLPVYLTGDEAQLYMRQANAPIAIGADRYEAGSRLLASAHPGVIFLDDGFQHIQLKRDFDLVLIDSLHPFGGGHLLPQGRLREPLDGLARANAFLLTRADECPNLRAIESVLRSANPRAPIFRSRVTGRRWTNERGEHLAVRSMPGAGSVAFCGLGNPKTFWRTLDQLGIDSAHRFEYGDHHRYTPLEMRRLARYAAAQGAERLLTTAKDAVNLCPEFASIIQPLRIYWLEIGVEIEQCAEFIGLIKSAVGLT